MAIPEQEVQERLEQDPEELRKRIAEEIRQRRIREQVAEEIRARRAEEAPDTTEAPEPAPVEEEGPPDRSIFGPTDVDRAMFGEGEEEDEAGGLADALGSIARGARGVGRLAARALPGGEPLIQRDEEELQEEPEPEEPEEPRRGALSETAAFSPAVAAEETGTAPEDVVRASPEIARGAGRGLSEVGFRTAIGTSELVGADQTAANLRADRELGREVYGESDSPAAAVGNVVAQLVGEGTLFMAPGALAQRLGQMSGVLKAGRAGLETAEGAGRGGRFLQLLANPQGARQRAVQTFLTGAPIDAAISQAGPEESMAGAIGALTGDDELVAIAQDPLATGAFEVVAGFAAGELLGEALMLASRGGGRSAAAGTRDLEELGRIAARAEAVGAKLPEDVLSQIDELPDDARRTFLESFGSEQDRLARAIEEAQAADAGVPRETPEDAAGAPRGAPEGEGQGVGRRAQEAPEEPGPRPELEDEVAPDVDPERQRILDMDRELQETAVDPERAVAEAGQETPRAPEPDTPGRIFFSEAGPVSRPGENIFIVDRTKLDPEGFVESGNRFPAFEGDLPEGAVVRVGRHGEVTDADYERALQELGRDASPEAIQRIRDEGGDPFSDVLFHASPEESLRTVPDRAPRGRTGRAARQDADRTPWPQREVQPAATGRTQQTLLPGDGSKVETEYAVVEAGDIRASHTPDFQKRPDELFPPEIQGRAYHGPQGRAAREHTETIVTGFDPDRAFDPTISIAEGPPTITRSGVNVAGNGRTIAQQRMYQTQPDRARQLIKDELMARAEEFGLDAEAIRGMEEPMLVRRVADESVDELDVDQLRAINQKSDVSTGKAKDIVSEAASRAEQMRSAEGALRHFAETIPEDATIRSYLGTKDGVDFLRRLVDDGVIAGAERARFIDANTGAPTAEGKSMVEQIMFAAAVGDADVLARAPAGVLRKLDTALPALIRANRVPDFNLEETLSEALDLLASARATDQTIGDLVSQVDLERPPADPDVVQMARFLEDAPKNSRAGRVGVKDAFRAYADEAEAFARQTESEDLFGFEPRGAEEARGTFAALTPPEDLPGEAFARAFDQSSSRTFRDLSMTEKGEKTSVMSDPSRPENVRRDPSTTRSSISSPSQSQTPSASELSRSTSIEGGVRGATESPSVEGTGSTRKIASEGFPVDEDGRVIIPPMSSTEGGARRLELTERYERQLGGFETIEEDFTQPLRELPERQPSPERMAEIEEEATRHLIDDPEAVELAGRMYAQLEEELPQLRSVLERLAGDAGEVVIPGLKPPRSFWNKVVRKMRDRSAVDAVEKVGDVGRGSVVFESLEEATNLVDDLRRRGVVVELDDWHAQADRGLGYGAHHLQIELRSGVVVEIQVQTRQVWRERAYYGGHDIYDLLESKERILANTTRGQRQAWSMLHYARDGYADAMEASLEGAATPYPRHSMQWDEGRERWVIKKGAEFEDGDLVEVDGQTPYAARRLLEEVEARRDPIRQFQTGKGPNATAHPLTHDLFGEPVQGAARQGDLLEGRGPQGMTEGVANARATVSQLEGKVARGAATDAEVRRYEEARSLVRRAEGQGLDAGEVSARARGQEEASPTPDDNRDLFSPLAPAAQAGERLPSSGKFYDRPEAIDAELVSPVEIIEELNDALGEALSGLGLKLAAGNLPKGGVFAKALGVFKSGENVIRQIDISDVPVYGHEAGHAMHKLFFSNTPGEWAKLTDDHFAGLPGSVRGELEDLAVGISDESKKEGWAEVWRRFIDNPEALEREAPNTLRFIEERLEEFPQIKNAWELARERYTTFRESSSQARVDSRISVGDRDPDVLSLEDRWARARTAILDDMEPVRRIVQAIRDEVGIEKFSEQADDLARLTRGSVGVANHFLEFGTLDFNTLRKKGPGLRDIIAPVKEDLDGFRRYMVARRAQELHERDILTGLRDEDVDAVVSQLEAKHGDTFTNAFDQIQDWNRGLLEYIRDAGVISKESFEAIVELNQSYVPFYRVISGEQTSAGLGGNFGHLFSPVKRIKGSGRDIVDPLESMVKNAMTYTQIAQKQQVSRALAALADKPGVGAVLEQMGTPIKRTQFRFGEVEGKLEDIVPGIDELLEDLRARRQEEFDRLTADMSPAEIEAAGIQVQDPAEEVLAVFRPGDAFGAPNTISVLVDGKRQWYEVDEELFAALEGLNREHLDAFARWMGVPARTLRAGATLAPEFLIRNPLRDQAMAFVQSEYGFVPFVDMARGAFELARKGEAYQQWISSGGYRAALTSLDRKSMQNGLRTMLDEGGVANVIKHPMDALQALSALMEDASRMGEFMNARAVEGTSKEGLQRAALASREISVDFARHGAKTAFLRHTSAFWNARLQGYDRLARAAKKNPARFAAKAFGIITLPSLLEYYANMDDPDYWEQPQWKRDLFWMVKVGDDFVSIPKPFELGLIFGTLPVRVLDSAIGGPGGGHEIRDFLEETLVKGELSGFMPSPTALMPLIENSVNYSFFRRRPIVPRSEQEVRAEFQAGPFTSEVAQMLGRWAPGDGISPRKIDNLLYSWSGGLGRLGTQIADVPLRAGEPDRPSRRVVDLPGIRGVTDPTPGFQSESIERFYDLYTEARTAQTTLNFLDRNQESEAYRAELENQEFAELRSRLPQLRDVASQLAEIRSTVDAIRRDPDMSADEKRDEIERLGLEAREIAASAIGREFTGGGG